MKKNVFLTLSFALISSIGIGQTETSNNEKINLQSPSGVSLFQSNSTNGVWATGTITADRWGIFEDATSSKERLTVLPGGNIGIGITNPGARLDILSNTGQTESLMRFKISDAPSDFLQIANTTGSPGQFIPLIKGFHQTDNRFSLAIMGSTSDAMDNGSNALINFNARRLNSAIQTRPLFVWTNYDQKMMTMSANGNLGIGTENPLATLHLKDQGNSGVTTLQLNNRIKFRGDGVMFWGSNADHGRLSWDTNKAIIGGQTGKDLSLLADGGEKMIVKTNGNVGIGTTTPLSKLTVVGHVNIGGEGNYRLRTRHIDGKDYQSRAVSDLYLNYSTGKHVRVGFGSQDSNLYVSGNVGIGTTDTKGFKLGVKGKIAAEEVKVALYNAWPDYVFENDYKLPTLPEVENHIAEKGHLENIPSAEEVAENGIQLGEMNAKLLLKIEELTLYMIEQNKKTEILIKEVEALKAKNAVLEQKMK